MISTPGFTEISQHTLQSAVGNQENFNEQVVLLNNAIMSKKLQQSSEPAQAAATQEKNSSFTGSGHSSYIGMGRGKGGFRGGPAAISNMANQSFQTSQNTTQYAT
jgi:hypothetical protein